MMSRAKSEAKTIENSEATQRKTSNRWFGTSNDDVFSCRMEVTGSFVHRPIDRGATRQFFSFSLQNQITRVPYLAVEIVRTAAPTAPKGKKVRFFEFREEKIDSSFRTKTVASVITAWRTSKQRLCSIPEVKTDRKTKRIVVRLSVRLATRLRGAYKVVPYNEAEYKTKVRVEGTPSFISARRFSSRRNARETSSTTR